MPCVSAGISRLQVYDTIPKTKCQHFLKNILKISIIQISCVILPLVLANSRLHTRIIRNATGTLCIAFLASSNKRIPLNTKTPKTALKIVIRTFSVLHCHALMPFFVVWGTTTTRATGYIFQYSNIKFPFGVKFLYANIKISHTQKLGPLLRPLCVTPQCRRYVGMFQCAYTVKLHPCYYQPSACPMQL